MNFRTFFLTAGVSVALVACGTETNTSETGDQADAAAASAAAVEYALDGASSSLVWTGSKAVGDSHTGTIAISEGSLAVEGDAITAGSFVIDMTSIVDTDIEDPEYNAKLVGHLKSDYFFGVETHPSATFEVTGIEAVTGEEGVTHHVSGNLTMKGITNEIKIPANVSMTDGTINATANFAIDRSKWEVKFGSGSFFDDLGDKLINDDIALELTLVANAG